MICKNVDKYEKSLFNALYAIVGIFMALSCRYFVID